MSAEPPEPIWPDEASNVRPLRAAPAPGELFPVTWVSDAVLNLDGRPVVKGLIEQGAFAVIYGPSGSGKSFFTADIAQHVATGAAWRGRKVNRSLVVYVASEAGASILKRFVAWRDNRLGESAERVPLAVLTRGPNLLADVDVEKLAEQLTALQQESGLPIGLVIFDTLSRSIPGGDENKAEDMTMAVKAADYLRDRFNCATAYVHHSGKDPEKGARGHSALFAAADVVLRVMDGAATLEKVRDGVAGERFGFVLEPVQLGLDADGDPVMTCLLNVSNEAIAPIDKQKIRGIGALALQALREALEASGETMPATSTIPAGVRGVLLDAWRERFRLRYGEDKAGEARRKAFMRAKDILLGASAIQISDPWVWIQ